MRKYTPCFPGSALIAFLFTVTLHANSTTTRAGSIAMETTSNGYYVLHAKLVLTDYPTAGDYAILQWGDGVDLAIQLNSFPVSSYNAAYLVSIDVQHSYSPGSYSVVLSCGLRVPWIRNMQDSDTSAFLLQAALIVDPNIGANSTPESDTTHFEPEMNISTINSVPMNVVDNENDSIQWNAGVPSGAIGYVYPGVSGGGNFILLSSQSIYEWNPQTPGLYSVCFSFEEWRILNNGNRILVSTTTREVLVDAGQVSALPEPDFANDVAVFPNPASRSITFQFAGPGSTHSLVIFDHLGRVVHSETTPKDLFSVSVHEFAEGIYFYSVIDQTGQSTTGKFIVAH